MNNLEEIIKNQMILSFQNNMMLKNQLINLFNSQYTQNIRYHIMWLFLHSFSFSYPDNPNDEYKIETANFLTNIIPKNLNGCGSCQNDYKIYIEKLNIYRIISSKKELSTFFVDLHNYINSKKFELNNQFNTNNLSQFILNIIGLEENAVIYMDYEIAKSKYGQIDYINLLETKYSINMFKLIEGKSLSNFFELFNKIKFDSSVFNIDIRII